MLEIECNGIILRILQGDITKQDTDAVVNAANKRLAPGGGVAGAIHSAAGPLLWEECKKVGGCETGKAVITKGYNLPSKLVIHTVGPIYRGRDEDPQKLSESYKNSLLIADENGVKTISFPAISTGAFGYPMREAAEIGIDTVCKTAPNLSSIEMVQFVLFDSRAYNIFKPKMSDS
ncbi:MAG: macro domain-containing protein [candidate division WOR-3 bacterium]|nr:macro domain-containing protein [candidate division WOR-3 bacterium]